MYTMHSDSGHILKVRSRGLCATNRRERSISSSAVFIQVNYVVSDRGAHGRAVSTMRRCLVFSWRCCVVVLLSVSVVNTQWLRSLRSRLASRDSSDEHHQSVSNSEQHDSSSSDDQSSSSFNVNDQYDSSSNDEHQR